MKDDELMEEGLKETPVNHGKATLPELKNIAMSPANSVSVTKEILKRSKMVMLKLASTERDKHAQYVGINGVNWMIPRDVWVKVPSEVIATLEEARITEYEVQADPSSKAQAQSSAKEVARFSMQVKPVEEPVVPAPAKVK